MNPVLDPTNNESSPSTTEENNSTSSQSGETPIVKPRKPRGFAAMDRAKVSEIASKGGKAAHAAGTAHQFSSDEARVAGKKGGVAPHVRRGRGPRIDKPAAPPAPAKPANDEEAKSA